MNKVILMGRLTRDAETGTAGETSYARFTLAVDRRVARNNGEKTADFINCVAFGKRAEFLEKYGKKGTKFCLEGRIQTGSYKNRDGVTVYTTDVAVENIEFAESKAQGASQSAPQPVADEGFMSIPDGIEGELQFM